jgi:hypothetical protein
VRPGRSTHGDDVVVLGGGADHRRAADVDVLDAILERARRAATVASNG